MRKIPEGEFFATVVSGDNTINFNKLAIGNRYKFRRNSDFDFLVTSGKALEYVGYLDRGVNAPNVAISSLDIRLSGNVLNE